MDLEERRQAALLEMRRQAALQATPVLPGPPPQPPESPVGLLNEGMLAELYAATQGASPVTRTLAGEQNYPVVGELVTEETDLAPANTVVQAAPDVFVDFDPQQHVVFPEGGRMLVYQRTPEMEEGPLASIGRLLAIGSLVPGRTAMQTAQVPSTMERNVQAMERAGVTPTIPLTTEGEGARRIAQAARAIPFGGAPIDRGLAQTRDEIEQAATNLVRQYGTAQEATEGGEVARIAGQNWLKRWRKVGRNQDRALRKSFGDTKIPLTEFRTALDEPFEQFDNPALAELFPQEWLNKWRKTVQESGGEVSYNDLLTLKQRIGKELSKPVIIADKDRGQLERLYGALSDDLQSAANKISPDLGKRVEARNRYWAEGYDRIKGSLREVLDPQGTPERVFETVMQISREKGKSANIRKLKDIRDTVGPDAWGDVVSSVLVRMGRAPGSAQVDTTFSPQTFLTQYNNLSDRAKEILFSGNSAGRRNLDNLVDNVLPQLRKLERFENVSQSGNVLTAAGIGGVGAGGIVTADPTLLLSAIGTVLGANATSRLLMNPRFTRWFAQVSSSMKNAGTNAPRFWLRSLPRLRAIAERNPEVEPVIPLVEGLAESMQTPEQLQMQANPAP